MEQQTVRSIHDTTRAAESADLAGESPYRVYEAAIKEREVAIVNLQHEILELQLLRDHRHDWDDVDRCRICGADGRA